MTDLSAIPTAILQAEILRREIENNAFDGQVKRIREYGDTDIIAAVKNGAMSVHAASLLVDCRVLCATGQIAAAIKKYRSETGSSLKVAKSVLGLS